MFQAQSALSRRVAAWFFLTLSSSACLFGQGRDPVSEGVASAVLLATNSIQLDRSVSVTAGDVVVNGAALGPLYGELALSIDQGGTTPATARLVANGIDLDPGTTVGSVFFNQLSNQGTIAGSQNTPLALPVFAVLPHLLDRPAGSQNVTVSNGTTLTLAEGEYGALNVGVGGKLVLEGGGYAFTSIAVASNGVVQFSAPSTVVVKQRISIASGVTFGPIAGAGFGAAAIEVHVHGKNGTTGALTETPAAVDVGKNATISANVLAPNGSLVLGQNCIASGSFFARDILAGRGGRFTLASALNQAPIANPQSVTTSGAAPLAITLTGSDPDGQPLTFAIDSSPTQGTLSSLTPLTPVSASVTYTPFGSGDVADAFTFRVTDPAGASAVAVVTINSHGEDPSEPPPATVVANDSSVPIVRDTATLLGLTAAAPDGVTVTFSIISGSGPFHGSLGTLVQGNPATITYTPAAGYIGADSFQFEACGVISSTTVCDTGTVSINVLDQRVETPVLAADVEVSTPSDTGVIISLGGSSTSSSILRLQSHAAMLQPAAVAGNVADANEDGIGDNHNALPGAVPGLMSAGVDLSGGAGSNGTVRMQIEFDISNVGSASSLDSATVRLHTHRGTIDSLDTKLLALVDDNDGLLTDGDFAALGELAAVMPVPSTTAMPVGSDGTFAFDVLPQLRDAINAGHQFFAIQGRVDESLTGPARGLEVYTTASGNITSNQTPELELTTPGITAPRTFTILSLPSNGTLIDSNSTMITSVPYTLPSAFVTYSPYVGFVGTNTFGFRVSLGTEFDDAVATIHVTLLDCSVTAAGCNDGR